MNFSRPTYIHIQEYLTQFEKTNLMDTWCCFELQAKTSDQPINY